MMRTILVPPFIATIAIIALGIVVMLLAPCSSEDALEFAEKNETSNVIQWHYHTPYNDTYQTFVTPIPQEEFEDSMRSIVFRDSTNLVEYPTDFVDADDKYVQLTAEYLAGLTEGFDDYNRVNVVLNFVRTGITYTTDSDLYGRTEFWAKPMETLYLQKGDCEDTAILFCSIISAMGYECALTTAPGHVAACVYLEGQEYFCETAGDIIDHPTSYPKQDYSIHQISDQGLAGKLNQFLADLGYTFYTFFN